MNLVSSLDIFNIIDETKWGVGLMTLKFENGKDYSKNILDEMFGWDTSWNSITIDAEAKKMNIRRGWGSGTYSFNLDGWTGRYSMPLEFLLSVHIATLKPDLTYEMARSFNTNILIRLREVSDGEMNSAYKIGEDEYREYSVVEQMVHQSGKSDDFFTSILNWFDDLSTSDKEVAAMLALGIDHVCEGDDKCKLERRKKEKNSNYYIC